MLSIFKGNDDTSQVIANKESMSETNVIIIIWKHLRRRRFSVPPSHSSLQRCSSESLSLAPKHMLATKISLSEQWIGYNEMLQSLEKWFNESIQKQKCCTMYTQDTNKFGLSWRGVCETGWIHYVPAFKCSACLLHVFSSRQRLNHMICSHGLWYELMRLIAMVKVMCVGLWLLKSQQCYLTDIVKLLIIWYVTRVVKHPCKKEACFLIVLNVHL